MKTFLLLGAAMLSLAGPALALDPSRDHDGGGDKGLSYVLAQPDGSFTMSGSMEDVLDAKRLRKKYGDDFLMFRRGGEAYLVTDPAILAKVKKIASRSKALGDRQSELGNRQGELGNQQGKIGEQMGKLGDQLGRAAETGDEAKLKALEAEMKKLELQERSLEKPQRELNAEQEKLNAQQEIVGQAIQSEIETLATEALSSGKAVLLK